MEIRTFRGIILFSRIISCQHAEMLILEKNSNRDLFLPADTTVNEKWLPAETVRVILLPAETRQEVESHGQSLQEAIYQAQQSRQEARDRG